jgi:hypothetical protein
MQGGYATGAETIGMAKAGGFIGTFEAVLEAGSDMGFLCSAPEDVTKPRFNATMRYSLRPKT